MQGTLGPLAILTLIVGACYMLYGIILVYHWIRYSESRAIAAFSIGSYAIAGAYLLGLMIMAMLSFSV